MRYAILFFFGLASLLCALYLGNFLLLGGDPFHLGVAGAAAAAAGLFLAALRRSRLFQARLLAAAGSTTLALYGVEVALSLVEGPHGQREVRLCRAQREGVPFDTRHRLDVVRDNRRTGRPWYTTVSPTYFYGNHLRIDGRAVLPLAGIPNAHIVNCNEGGRYATYASDEQGFNNPAGIWSLPGPIQAVLVGDSFTAGSCVAPGDGFVDLVRRRWPRTLNLGSTGNGPLAELATLREYLRGREAHHVFWAYFEGNDLADLTGKELSEPMLARYLDPGFTQGLVELRDRLAPALRDLVDRAMAEWAARRPEPKPAPRRSSLTLPRIRKLVSRARAPTPPRVTIDYELEVFARILRLAAAEVARCGGELVFVYLPAFHRWGGPHRDRSGAHLHDEVIRTARSLGMDVLDLTAAFASHRDPTRLFPFRMPGHYNREGNALVARAILDYLERRA